MTGFDEALDRSDHSQTDSSTDSGADDFPRGMLASPTRIQL